MTLDEGDFGGWSNGLELLGDELSALLVAAGEEEVGGIVLGEDLEGVCS